MIGSRRYLSGTCHSSRTGGGAAGEVWAALPAGPAAATCGCVDPRTVTERESMVFLIITDKKVGSEGLNTLFHSNNNKLSYCTALAM